MRSCSLNQVRKSVSVVVFTCKSGIKKEPATQCLAKLKEILSVAIFYCQIKIRACQEIDSYGISYGYKMIKKTSVNYIHEVMNLF